MLLLLTGCEDKRPTVVLLGDSITRAMEPPCVWNHPNPFVRFARTTLMHTLGRGCIGLFDIHKELPEYNVIVAGYSDRRTDQLWKDTYKDGHGEDHVSEVFRMSPDVVVLMIGTNDMKQRVPVARIVQNVQAIKMMLPRVLVASIPYLKGYSHADVDAFNAAIHPDIDYFSALDSEGQQKAGMFVDDIHPGPLGYKAMLPVLVDRLPNAVKRESLRQRLAGR